MEGKTQQRSVPKAERRSSTQRASDTSSENSRPSGANFVCRMGMPPLVESVYIRDMPPRFVPNARRSF